MSAAGASGGGVLGPRTPRLEVTSLSDARVTFTLSEADGSVANSLRRAMMAEVPVVAFDLVNI
jgi:DNA-directed RNA polymerase II subunit RPB3